MENTNTFDFDRYWAELNAGDEGDGPSGLSMMVGGQKFPLPPTLPAMLVLARMRSEERSVADLFKAGDAIFGRDALDRWSASGMSVNKIVALIIAAERMILGDSPEEVMASVQSAEKKPTRRRKRASSTSSATGR